MKKLPFYIFVYLGFFVAFIFRDILNLPPVDHVFKEIIIPYSLSLASSIGAFFAWYFKDDDLINKKISWVIFASTVYAALSLIAPSSGPGYNQFILTSVVLMASSYCVVASLAFNNAAPKRWLLAVVFFVYVDIAFCFATLYRATSGIEFSSCASKAVTPLDALYFSFTTMSTIGFGDIIPTESGRIVVVIQHLLTLILMGFVLSEVVGLPHRKPTTPVPKD